MLKIARLRSLPFLAAIAVLAHYPRWFLLLDESAVWLGIKPWADDFAVACRWDCAYYAGQSEGLTPARAAFFPLFPLVARSFHVLLPALSWRGAVVASSNLLSVAAVMALIALGTEIWRGREWAKRPWPAWVLGLAVAVFPFSQFYSYGYSESLFALLFAWSALALARGNWRWAALAAGLCAATRPQGIWVAAVVGALYLTQGFGRGSARERRVSEAWVVSLLLALPISLYAFWNLVACGDPLYFIKAQGQWGRHFDFWEGLKNQLPRYELNRVLFYLSLLASWRFIRRPEAHWKLLGWTSFLMAEIPLFVGGFAFSYSRFMATNLGLFAFLAELLAARAWLLILALLWALPWLNLEIVRWVRMTPYHGIGP